jgi:AcrR family transcriptional regulator
MADIADRADVHPATLYRRWNTLDGLVMDMVSEMWERLNPIPDSGSLERDLEVFATRSVSGINGTAGMMGVRALLMIRAQRMQQDGLPPALLKRRLDIEQMLDRAAARGETPPSVDQVLEGIVAPMYFRLLFGGETTKAYARVLVRRVLAQRSEADEPPPRRGGE